MYPEVPTQNALQVKRIIGQRDARLKKNQDKAVIQSKRKSKDELVREMSVHCRFLACFLSNVLQSSSLFISFLSVQYRYACLSVYARPKVCIRNPIKLSYDIESHWSYMLT